MKSSNQRWVEENERKLIDVERQLAKIVVYAYEMDPNSVPQEFRLACIDLLSVREKLSEARELLSRCG